jgi:hypothetical protein
MVADYTEKIEAGLMLYLKEHYGLTVDSAWLNESEVERGWHEGCETCGCGASEDTISFTIGFKDGSYPYSQSREISGSTLDFFPILLEYIDRATT